MPQQTVTAYSKLLQKKFDWGVRLLAEVYLINDPDAKVEPMAEKAWAHVESLASQAKSAAPEPDDFVIEFVKRAIRLANQLLNDGTKV